MVVVVVKVEKRSYHFYNHFNPFNLCLFLYVIPTCYKPCLYRQFLCCKAQCLFSNFHWHTFGFEDDPSGANYRYPVFRGTFTFTHTYFRWLLGYRLVREYPDPYLAFTFHKTCYSDTCSFDLAAGDPGRFERFDTERTECKLSTTSGVPFHSAFLHFPELRSFWL